jgi:hypothetical protein
MTYVLIFVFHAFLDWGDTTIKLEFNSKAACEQGAADLAAKLKTGPYKAVCLKK